MINTLPLDEFEKHADNIYEAIIVLARRARQINDEQKQLFHKEGEEEEYGDYEEESIDHEYNSEDYLRLPKPTTLALEEFMSGKIKFEYRDVSEEKEEGE